MTKETMENKDYKNLAKAYYYMLRRVIKMFSKGYLRLDGYSLTAMKEWDNFVWNCKTFGVDKKWEN